MRLSGVRRAIARALLLALPVVAGASVVAAEDGQSAAWEPRELTFDYLGMTSHYSCDGLRNRVEQALVELGAGAGLAVEPYACTNSGGVERFPSLRIRMATLRPAAGAARPGDVPAHWGAVRLAGPGRLEPGDCELAEQIRDQILPLFTTRRLQAQLNCIPHQETAGNIALSVEVLLPDQARQR
jgi:hypothetical protein